MRLSPGRLALAQGAFYVATGLWPIVSMRTFELASGPKLEKWLVKTTGALIAAVGAAMIVGARRGAPSPTPALGALSAASLAACDVWYAGKGRIKKTYLLDAAVEIALLSAWALSSRRVSVLRAAPAARVRRNETLVRIDHPDAPSVPG